MADLNREAGHAIERQRRQLAEAVVARQYDRQPELRERYGTGGQAKCVQDTEYHLAYLAAAVMYSSQVLFCDYIAWAKMVLAAIGVVPQDLEANLLCLRDVLTVQLPAESAAVVAPIIDAALRMLPDAPLESPSFLDGDDALTALARRYLQALLRAERHQASHLILDAVRDGVTVDDIYLRVFARSQREVGRLWQCREITVAQEHYCSAATQLVMSQLYPYLFALPKSGLRLAAASVREELHEIGLRIVTDLLEADGWDTLYLGANVPAEALLRTIEQQRPNLLVISATMSFHLGDVERLITLVRSCAGGQGLPIMVGGYPFNVDSELWRRVGADGQGANAEQAREVASRLVHAPRPTGRGGRKTYPVEMPAGPDSGPSAGPRVGTVYDEMTRLNNELITAQRELARKSAQLESLNEQLVEADRRKDEFLAMLGHEMRNPLAPLRTAVDLLQRPGVDRSMVERTGALMERQVQQLGRLVDDLLDLSRIARGKVTLVQERVDLGQVLSRAADACRELVESRRHALTVSLPDPPIVLLADPARLEQILTNLLHNAARYTPEGGRIRLTATRAAGAAVIRIRDTGIGIPPEMLSRIFGLFAQAERTQERVAGGLGIGLSLVKSLTEMHGGTVEAHSGGAGQGSEFVVRWPLQEDEPSARREPPPQPALVIERPLRILVVDDNVDAAESLAMLLRLWGHEVAIAHDGPAALKVAESAPPTIALLDIGLPGMDGYELARNLREQGGLEHTVLVALTGWGQQEDRRRSASAGFDHHLVKPVDLSALRDVLAHAHADRPS